MDHDGWAMENAAATYVIVTTRTGREFDATVVAVGSMTDLAGRLQSGESLRRWITDSDPIVGQPVNFGEHVDIY